MKASKKEFQFSIFAIVRAVVTWANFNGFTAETCHHCDRTANVLAGGPGWFCVCGKYIVQSWSHHQIPHRWPGLGPSQWKITWATRLGRAVEVLKYLSQGRLLQQTDSDYVFTWFRERRTGTRRFLNPFHLVPTDGFSTSYRIGVSASTMRLLRWSFLVGSDYRITRLGCLVLSFVVDRKTRFSVLFLV